MARPSNYTEEQLIDILKKIGVGKLSKRYLDSKSDLPGSSTFIRKFGSWKRALEKAGLSQGEITGRKVKKDIFVIGSKEFDLNEVYLDEYVFFSKEEVYNYIRQNSVDQCIKDLVIPFIEFLYKYVEKNGWFFPKKTTTEDWEKLIKEMREKPGVLNSSSSVGTRELKGHFASYWRSYPKDKRSHVADVFKNRNILFKLIKYRFGLSESKKYKYVFGGENIECSELFNISFKQVRTAFEVNKYTVSLFKPLLAKWIYENYGFEGMMVWDPCCGFAGRLLGFLSAFKTGKYIGNDPNSLLCDEIVSLVNQLNEGQRVDIFNLPLEEVNISGVDLVFTCPPYYDMEIYSLDETQSIQKYKTKTEWDGGFLKDLIEKSYFSLRCGGKAIFVIDNKNVSLVKLISKMAGFDVIETIPIKNTKTHLTKVESYEYIIIMVKGNKHV